MTLTTAKDDSAMNLATRFGPILKAGFPNEHSVTRFQVAHALAEAALAFFPSEAATDRVFHALYGPDVDPFQNPNGWEFAEQLANAALASLTAPSPSGDVAGEAQAYASELREIAGMVAQTPDGPLRWKQYRLAAIADYLAALQGQPAESVAWMYERNGERFVAIHNDWGKTTWDESDREHHKSQGWTEHVLVYASPPQPEREVECVLCAGKCRGHSLGQPEQWEPEQGSHAGEEADPKALCDSCGEYSHDCRCEPHRIALWNVLRKRGMSQDVCIQIISDTFGPARTALEGGE